MDPLCNQAVTMTVSLTSQVEAVIVPTCLIILLLETPIKHVEQTSQSISVKATQMLATVWSILWTRSMLRVTAQEKVQLDLAKEVDGKRSTTKTVTLDLWELSLAATSQENGWRLKIAFF